jgi:hypothetical protein
VLPITCRCRSIRLKCDLKFSIRRGRWQRNIRTLRDGCSGATFSAAIRPASWDEDRAMRMESWPAGRLQPRGADFGSCRQWAPNRHRLMGQGINGVTDDYSGAQQASGSRWRDFPGHEVTIAGNLQQMYRGGRSDRPGHVTRSHRLGASMRSLLPGLAGGMTFGRRREQVVSVRSPQAWWDRSSSSASAPGATARQGVSAAVGPRALDDLRHRFLQLPGRKRRASSACARTRPLRLPAMSRRDAGQAQLAAQCIDGRARLPRSAANMDHHASSSAPTGSLLRGRAR